MILDLITNPDAFFREEAESPRLLGAAGIVFIAGVLGAITSYLLLSQIVSVLSAEGGQVVSILAYTFGMGGALVAQFVIWFVFAILFHVISIVFDGEGKFSKTLTLTGWGFLPSIFGGLLGIGAMYLALQGIPAPTSPEAIQAYSVAVTQSGTLRLASIVGIVFTLWSAFLWAFAVKHARKLSFRQGLYTVAIPIAINIVLSVFGQVFTL